ncbi:MAG: mechanosensitive ion channel family protein, partial [Sphingomonas sp.]
ALGFVAAFAVYHLLRGLNMARGVAWTVAIIVFVALVSHAVGGLAAITRLLDRIGFEVGSHRFSLMALVTVVIVAVALFAAVRLANRMIGHTIGRAGSLDATQRLLAQKLAGIILLMDRSIKPGDVIVVGDSFGWVNKIGVRAVSVVTRDGKEHLIPNENLMTQEVENWSYSDRKVRVRIPVGVAYTCDLKLAQELMLRAASESPRVLDTPKPNVWLKAFGDSSVDHEILAWITDPEGGVGNVRSDVLNRLWWLFKEHDIEIPFPQRDVHIRSVPEPKSPD